MFNDEDFGSDTDDDDYVPEGDGHDASEEENSGVEEDTVGEGGVPKKKSKKKKEKAKVNHRLGIFSENEEKTDWNKEILEEKKEAEEIKEKEKLNSLWSDFKADVGAKPKPTKPKSTGGLGALFSTCNDPPPTVTAKQEAKPKNLLSSLFDTNGDSKDKCEEKPVEKPKAKSILSGLFDAEPSNDEKESKEEGEESKSSKIEITNVFDFAGEEVKVTKHVDADSSEAQKYLKKQEESSKPNLATKRPGGLASVVGQFAKKQKMGCLDKSKLDWNSFVKEEGIDEELKTHNKGKDGFVEKQIFLERADLRQFEVEKSMREKVRRQNQL